MPSLIHIILRNEIRNSYDIHVGIDVEHIAAAIMNSYPHASKFVITDSNIKRLYVKRLIIAMFGVDSPAQIVTVPAGELSKNRTMKERIEDGLISLGAARDSLIIALGGGMIGDLAGFVASTLYRGIPYVQIPTSLIAQVDSSIGGKVAVDHPAGKNLIGAFYQPEAVYIDPAMLKTLPIREFRNGMAEVIKYAAILDAWLFRYLEENRSRIMRRVPSSLFRIVKRCCELKKNVVEKDEKENDLRRILNFGHTIGHAVESLSHYRISHGEAVAIGMAAEAKISLSKGLLGHDGYRRLSKLLKAYGLPTHLPLRMDTDALMRTTLHDKKLQGGNVHYTLLERIGKARVGVVLTSADALRFLES